MALRAIKPGDGEPPAPEFEPIPPSVHSPVLVRDAVLSLDAKVLRVSGPWVTLSVAGEMLRVLRTRLEKEITQ